jgi:hypothetical protein
MSRALICGWTLFLGFLGLAGCASWGTKTEGPLRQATAEELTELLRQRADAIQTMKGLCRAQIKGPGIPIGQRIEVAVFYRRPGIMRLQGINRVGGRLFDFSLAGDQYRLHLPDEGEDYAGSLEELVKVERLGRSIHMSLLAMNGLVGTVPVATGQPVQLTEEGSRYRLDVWPSREASASTAAKPVRRLWFDRRSLQVVQEELIGGSGAVEVRVTYDDYRPVPGVSVGESFTKPFAIVTQDARGQGSLHLSVLEFVPNPSLTPDDFRVPRRGAAS